MTASSVESVRFIVGSIAQTAVDNEQEFGDLDAVVGDGDFGFSLARGFEKVLEDLDTYPADDAGAFLQAVAMTISSRIGGTSGPIWGTAFLRAAMVAKGRGTLASGRRRRDAPSFGRRASRPGARPSSVTRPCLTPWSPPSTNWNELPTTAMRASGSSTASRPKRGRRLRRPAVFRRCADGRATAGARSIGSPDAGAMALAVIAERLAAAWPDAPGRQQPLNSTTTSRKRTPMKKFLDDPKQFVPQMLEGLALANPDTLIYVPEYNLIQRADSPSDDRVSVVQGSGSGHEPAHVMTVGRGMLVRRVPG